LGEECACLAALQGGQAGAGVYGGDSVSCGSAGGAAWRRAGHAAV